MELSFHHGGVSGTVLHIEHDLLAADLTRESIARWPGLNHLGIAPRGRLGIELCQRRNPDVVLLELLMPDLDGFTIVDELAKLPEPPRVLLFTDLADEATLYRMSRSSVWGVVWKTRRAFEELPLALFEVLSGRRYFQSETQDAFRSLRRKSDAFFKILSEREIELLPSYGLGLTDGEIAIQMGLAPATIRCHRQHIMAKLNIHRVEELMRWATDKGFVQVARPAPPCVVVLEG